MVRILRSGCGVSSKPILGFRKNVNQGEPTMHTFLIIMLAFVCSLMHYRVKQLEKLHKKELEEQRQQDDYTNGRW